MAIEGGMSSSGSYVLMLCELDGDRQLPVVIGAYEAQAILLAKENVETRRPLTHETMLKTMKQFGLSLKRVTIDKVVDGVFYATLHVSDGFNEQTVDSRTTDAVTLALLSEAPVFVDDKVMEECGMKVESGEWGEESEERKAESGERRVEALEKELKRCEEEENYERAAEIQAEIERIKR